MIKLYISNFSEKYSIINEDHVVDGSFYFKEEGGVRFSTPYDINFDHKITLKILKYVAEFDFRREFNDL